MPLEPCVADVIEYVDDVDLALSAAGSPGAGEVQLTSARCRST